MKGPADEGYPTLSRQVFGLVLIFGSFLFALVIQSVVFIRADWMLADLAYHRGVAYTMQGAMFQGEGPYAGLISYYGGLFPLALGVASEVTGRSFDTILSVLSWFGTLLLPAAFLLLGRRLWRDDLFAVGFFVLLGTLAVPLTTNWEELWVESVLPSGASYWPIYPRDIALALACVAIWAVTSDRRRVRTIGLGLVIGAVGLFHAQMAILLTWFLVLFAIWRSARSRRWEPLAELLMAGGDRPRGHGLVVDSARCRVRRIGRAVHRRPCKPGAVHRRPVESSSSDTAPRASSPRSPQSPSQSDDRPTARRGSSSPGSRRSCHSSCSAGSRRRSISSRSAASG